MSETAVLGCNLLLKVRQARRHLPPGEAEVREEVTAGLLIGVGHTCEEPRAGGLSQRALSYGVDGNILK